MNSPPLELRGVSKKFGATIAVDHLDLSIARGEFLTLLGPSGCGKTTALRLISGLEIPDEGARSPHHPKSRCAHYPLSTLAHGQLVTPSEDRTPQLTSAPVPQPRVGVFVHTRAFASRSTSWLVVPQRLRTRTQSLDC